MAICPPFYLKEEWCESNISGQLYPSIIILPAVATALVSLHLQFGKQKSRLLCHTFFHRIHNYHRSICFDAKFKVK